MITSIPVDTKAVSSTDVDTATFMITVYLNISLPTNSIFLNHKYPYLFLFISANHLRRCYLRCLGYTYLIHLE